MWKKKKWRGSFRFPRRQSGQESKATKLLQRIKNWKKTNQSLKKEQEERKWETQLDAWPQSLKKRPLEKLKSILAYATLITATGGLFYMCVNENIIQLLEDSSRRYKAASIVLECADYLPPKGILNKAEIRELANRMGYQPQNVNVQWEVNTLLDEPFVKTSSLSTDLYSDDYPMKKDGIQPPDTWRWEQALQSYMNDRNPCAQDPAGKAEFPSNAQTSR